MESGNMSRKGRAAWLLLLVLVGTSVTVGEGRAGSADWLITPEEAARAPAPDDDLIRSRGLFGSSGVGMDAGPGIEILKPTAEERQPKPLRILIRFIARSQPVDLSTLKVTVLKIIGIDITDRIQPYVTAEGIDIQEAKIPTGNHRLRISIADTTGQTSAREMTLDVS
jgi:hypothetical protein